MDKRFCLALFLSLIVIAMSQLLFSSSARRPYGQGAAGSDSVSGLKTTASSSQVGTTQSPNGQTSGTTNSQGGVGRAAEAATSGSIARSVAEMTVITTPKAIYRFGSVGGAPVSIVIRDYKNRSAGGSLVDLGVPGSPLLRYQLVTPADTADPANWPFNPTRPRDTKGGQTPHHRPSGKKSRRA